jgi:hypothetical protein
MNTDFRPDWEDLLHEQLRQLPDCHAPVTLVNRVMSAVRAQEQLPWWRRSCWTWPPAVRVLALVFFSILLCYLTYCLFQAGTPGWFSTVTTQLRAMTAPLADVGNCLSSVAGAVAVVLRKAGTVLWVGVALAALAMYLSCIGLGTMMYRVACAK